MQGILFDKDGTLFEFAATWEGFAQRFLIGLSGDDLSLAQRLGRVIGFDVEARQFAPDSIVIAGTAEEVAVELLPHLPDMSLEQLVNLQNAEAAHATLVPATPLAPFLDGLRARGLRLGVATNDAEAPAFAHLDAYDVRDRFDFVAGYDSGYGGKPEPGQLIAFVEQNGLDAGQVAMVGDSLHDLIAGRAAGMVTIGVLTGMATHDMLAPHADVVLPNIADIPAWLDQRG